MSSLACVLLRSSAILMLALAPACQRLAQPPQTLDSVEENAQAVLHTAGGAHFRRAVLRTAAGDTVGAVTFLRAHGDRISVIASVDFPGARPGFHGIHIHANDNPANGEGCVADPAAAPATHFLSADGHYNPSMHGHGEHGGDMPNITILDDGAGLLSFLDELDLDDIDGRAMILHEGVDNHGHIPLGTAANQYAANGPEALALTQATGNAGPRIACGLIQ
jgi:superoxide dismutase, Cu-Zn family